MHTLKRISPSGVSAALQKAERYRLLNDSSAAESICRDILEIEPENQHALIVLLLSITDQFGDDLGEAVRRARDVLPRLRDEYKRLYYAGIICERRAKAQRRQSVPGAGAMAYESLQEAASFIETIEKRQGLKIGCPEEIAFSSGFIDADRLRRLAEPLRSSGYGAYLLGLLNTR